MASLSSSSTKARRARKYCPSAHGGKREQVRELFVVYDADGTMAGEIIYMTRKLLGIGHCAACDITHGRRKEKPEFTQLKMVGWAVPLHNIHRDEMDFELKKAVNGLLPCVAARTEHRDVVLVGPKELEKCSGEVLCFQKIVNDALRKHGLYTPRRKSVCTVPGNEAQSCSGDSAENDNHGAMQDAVVP